ncbi:hypothetical protein BX666DRAFT_549104 [Dichotomocladium elegans]|nr:hypothetical protein BX666DRAFT_549104 [Dichotomocladium elegans]
MIRTTGTGLLVVTVILLSWLPSSTVDIISFPATQTSYYIRCNYTGTLENLLIALITLVAALSLLLALFLAIKTWTVGSRHPKYAEAKYMVLSIYNIFFSSLIGYITFRSSADYITRHYLCAAMIVWGTTIALLLLYLPKLHTIYGKMIARKRISGRVLMNQDRWNNNNSNNNNNGNGNHHFTVTQQLQQTDTNAGELISINRMIASPFSSGDYLFDQKRPIHLYHRLCSDGIDAEAYEARMPVQEIFRYFPYLSAWDMKHIILFPRVGYFSYVSVSQS